MWRGLDLRRVRLVGPYVPAMNRVAETSRKRSAWIGAHAPSGGRHRYRPRLGRRAGCARCGVGASGRKLSSGGFT